MEAIYTIGVTLFGGGIGNTAYYEAEGLNRNNALKYIVVYDYKKHKIPNDKVKRLKFLKYIDMSLGFTRARFIPKLPPSKNVRAVGTNTLRNATNSREFLKQAKDVLGHSIQIIANHYWYYSCHNKGLFVS
jgi:hypothetical protein